MCRNMEGTQANYESVEGVNMKLWEVGDTSNGELIKRRQEPWHSKCISRQKDHTREDRTEVTTEETVQERDEQLPRRERHLLDKAVNSCKGFSSHRIKWLQIHVSVGRGDKSQFKLLCLVNFPGSLFEE